MAWKTMVKGLGMAALFAAIATPAFAQAGDAPQDEKTRKAGILNAELFLAITHDDPSAADAALAHGADPNGRNWLGFTPLMWAAMKGNQKIADTLLAHKADMDAAGNYGTALSTSLIGRKESMALHLIDRGAGIHGTRVDGATALMIAAGNGETQVIRALLDRKDNPNAVDGDGATGGYLEEALPAVTDGTHATEWVLEVGRTAGGRFVYDPANNSESAGERS